MSTPSETAGGAAAPRPPEKQAGRLRRALARIAAALGLGGVFVASLIGGALLHLDLPPARRQIERFARSALEGVFEGSVELDGLTHVGLDGIAVSDVVVRAPPVTTDPRAAPDPRAPGGAEVLHARGVRVEASLPTIARSLLGSGDLRIDLPFVRIEQIDARVEPDDKGQLTIATAFNPRAATGQAEPGRPLRLSLGHAEIGAVFVRGKPDGEHAIDATLSRLGGSLHIEPGAMAIDLAPMGVTERAALPGALAGTVDLHLRTSGPKTPEDTATPSNTRIWGAFGGRVGAVEVVARALLDGDHVEATAVAPQARPDQVKALLPAYPLDDVVAVSADASGDLPEIDVHVSALTDHSGSAGAEGHIVIGQPLRADLTFHTTDLDPHSGAPEAPHVRVTSRGKVHVELGKVLSMRAEVQTEPTQINGTPVPSADAAAEYDGSLWKGSAKVHEPGAPIEATFATERDGGVRFEATATVPSLAKVERVRQAHLGGSAHVHTAGTVRGGVLDAGVDGEVSRFRAGSSVAIDRASLRGRLRGPIAGLSVEATLSATDALAGGYGATDALVRVSGSVAKPFVRVHAVDTNKNLIDVSAAVDPAGSGASGVRVRIERDGSVAEGSIARIRPSGGALAVSGIELEGQRFGKLAGSLSIAGGEITGALHAQRLDLGAVRKFAGLPGGLAGQADIDVELARAPHGRKGTVHLALHDAAMDAAPGVPIKGVSADVHATFDADRVSAGGTVSLTGTGDRCSGSIAKVRFESADGRLEGALLSAATWRTASGRANVAADDWDLSCLAPVLQPLGLPFSEIFGMVSAKATLSRERGARLPSVLGLSAVTRYLSITGPRPPGLTSEPWSSRDIDVELTGDFDGDTGRAELGAELFDDSLLATITAGATLDVVALLDPSKRDGALHTTPLAGHVSVPRRQIQSFRTLPSFVRDKLPAIRGEAAADVYAAGSLAHPNAVVRVFGWSVAPGPTDAGLDNPWAVPIDLDAAASYDGTLAALDAHLAHRDREIAAAEARITVPADKLASGAPSLEAITGGRASVTLTDLPLGDIPALGDRALAGHLAGSASIDGLGTSAPRLALDLRSADLAIGPDLVFPETRITLGTRHRPRSLDTTAVATVHMADRQGGGIDAAGYLDVLWKSGLVPALREDRPADLYARFHRFRLAAVEPALAGALLEVDGLLDGDVRVGWGRLDEREKGAFDADLRVTGGAFYVPRLGQKMRLLTEDGQPLHIVADRSGDIRVEHLVASGNAGNLRASATAHMDGLAFQKATAEITIPDNQALPITLEGVELGEVSGSIHVAAHSDAARGDAEAHKRPPMLTVEVSSSDLHLQIPSSSSRDVQSLDPDPDIVILQPQKPPEEPAEPGGRELQIIARLENMVIEGEGVRITLSTPKDSPPTIVVDERTLARGDIRLLKGHLEVMGRKFELDQGTVHLRSDDVSNPYLNVTAHWDAPDGSTIFVDYVGYLKPITQEKLRIRSNPPRTQQQALAMVLFGSETGGALTTGSAGGSSDTSPANAVGQAAVGIGGQLAAQQFNQLLKGIAPLKGLSTRFGSTEGGSVKGSLVYQLGDTVSASATVEGAGAAVGSAPAATTAGNANAPGASVSVDWRFYKNWLIRASVGTSSDIAKGEVDLLWQYRY